MGSLSTPRTPTRTPGTLSCSHPQTLPGFCWHFCLYPGREETTRALSSHKRVLLIPQGWLKRLEKLLREETSPWSNPDGEAKPGERLDGHLQGTVWQNHPEVKSCLVWGRGVKFPAGFIQDALCSWCPVIHHPERGGCCLSMCAGPQNDDFPFLLQVFWRGRAEGDAKRREKKELRWVLREYKR